MKFCLAISTVSLLLLILPISVLEQSFEDVQGRPQIDPNKDYGVFASFDNGEFHVRMANNRASSVRFKDQVHIFAEYGKDASFTNQQTPLQTNKLLTAITIV